MTMMTHTAAPAPIGLRIRINPNIRINLGFFAKIAKALVEAYHRSRDAQNLHKAHDAILKDIGFSRVKVNGNTYLF